MSTRDLYFQKTYLNDSSDDIWKEYYIPFYNNIDWDFWKIFDYGKLLGTTKRRYVMCHEKSIEFKQCKLAGELDFNFNSNEDDPKNWQKGKCEYYEKCLNESKLSKEEKDNALKLLEECKERSHKCCNYSLLIMTGGLNSMKGITKHKEDKRCLDRFDCFVFNLNDYFEKHSKEENKEHFEHVIFSQARKRNCAKANRECLYNYLSLFKNIEDYFKKNYTIDNRKLIEDLIKSGSKPINSGERVVEYLKLAKMFWDEKEKSFQ